MIGYSIFFFYLVKDRKYPEYERLMEDMFNRYHMDIVGKGQRNDLVDPFEVYDQIIETYFNDRGYISFDQFLQQSFQPFCAGYLHSRHEKITKQNYPLAWGANRYEYYERIGKEIIQQEQKNTPDVESLLYTTFDPTTVSKELAVVEGYKQYSSIISSAEKVLSPQTYAFLFGNSQLNYKGVELVFRLIVSHPWNVDSPIVGEFYKHLYNDIFPELEHPVSIRLT